MTALVELLGQEKSLIQEFIATLNSEQEALKQGNIEAITKLSSDKARLIGALNSVEQERHRFLAQSGCPATREGMLEWLGKNKTERAVAMEWSRLLKLAAEARELNNLNGQLIAIRLQATNQALETLTQPIPQQRTSLYGPNGHTALQTGYRVIDAA